MTNILLIRRTLVAFYGLILIEAYNPRTEPDWNDAAESKQVASSDDALIIGTSEYTVVVDLYTGDPPSFSDSPTFEGVLNIDSSAISVRNVNMPNDETLILPRAGAWHLKVFARPKLRARHILVYLPEYSDPDFPNLKDLEPRSS